MSREDRFQVFLSPCKKAFFPHNDERSPVESTLYQFFIKWSHMNSFVLSSASGKLSSNNQSTVMRSSCCQTYSLHLSYSSLLVPLPPIEPLKKVTNRSRKDNLVRLIIERLLCSGNLLWKITWGVNIHL